MKRVLMVDPAPICKEFIKDKLTAEKISVDIVQGRRDAFTKLLSLLPDLVIVDVTEDFEESIDFLKRKHQDPNAYKIPTILLGPSISPENLLVLMKLGVKKYFARPLALDSFIETVSSLIAVPIPLDDTPCIMDFHKNGNLLVLDITGELNRDKILLAKYFLSDIISNYSITTPKLLVLMPAMHFSFIDGINLEMFFDNLIYVPRIIKKELKLICTDVFLKQFISGHAEYAGIQLEPTLIGVINSLIENANTKDLSDMLTEKILSADPLPLPCSFDIRFSKDN